MNHVLSVDENGNVDSLWTDKFPLGELGTMSVSRAGEIKFNESIQMWEVFMYGSSVAVYANTSYEACRAWEDEYVNRQMLNK